jgi:glycolate oxidase
MHAVPNSQFINLLRNICGESNVLTTDIESYGSDHTEDLSFPPEVVVKPDTAEKVAAILGLCNSENIPVYPRGAGTGLSGGSLPVKPGVSLSVEKLNRIIEIDTQNFMVTVESGVINQVLRDAVEAVDLFYPPDPASRGSCFLGGNIAHGSGGPRAVKYGTTKDYVLNLQEPIP